MSTKPLYTPESVDEALLVLDNTLAALSNKFATGQGIDDAVVYSAIDMAAQKLRPVPTPDHDAETLEQLARKHPIDLPWMQPVVAVGIPSNPPCSPLNCDGCGTCQPR